MVTVIDRNNPKEMNADMQQFQKIYKIFSYVGLTPLHLYSEQLSHRLISKAYVALLLVVVSIAATFSLQDRRKEIVPGALNLFNMYLGVLGDTLFHVACLFTTTISGKNWASFFTQIETLDRKFLEPPDHSVASVLIPFVLGHVTYLVVIILWLFINMNQLVFTFYATSLYLFMTYNIFEHIAIGIVTKRYHWLRNEMKTLHKEYNVQCHVSTIFEKYGILNCIVEQLDVLFGWPNLLFNVRLVISVLNSVDLIFMEGLIVQSDETNVLILMIQNLASIATMFVSI